MREIIKALGQHRVKGNEITFRKCPFCGSSGKGDDYTFSINREEGVYNCFRGSCGASGNLKQLAEKLNIRMADDYSNIHVSEKNYSKPKQKILTPQEQVYKYFTGRMISKKTVDFAEVGMTDKGWISYNYKDEKGELTFRKFRSVKQKKIMREKDTKPIFYMMDKINSFESVIITEGEEDCLSIWEAGYTNAVSLPSGCSDMTAITNCWEWINSFNEIIIWTDSDKAGVKAREEISHRLGEYKCKYIESEKFPDANDALKFGGVEKLKEIIESAEYIAINEVIKLSGIDIYKNEDHQEHVDSGFNHINKMTHGGYRRGDVILWTGYTSSGKSTILSQELTHFIEQKEKICVYSSESANKKIATTLYSQCCEEAKMKRNFNKKYGYEYHTVTEANCDLIRSWVGDKFFVMKDGYSGKYTDLFKLFLSIHLRYNVKTFVIDNLATILPYSQSSLNDTQTAFIEEAQLFAVENNVTVHIVAHQKNLTEGKKPRPSLYGVMGSSNLSNLADVVIGIERLTEEDEYDGNIIILKERETGNIDNVEALYFTSANKTFRETTNININKLSWDKTDSFQGW